jgi:hypothetical protein
VVARDRRNVHDYTNTCTPSIFLIGRLARK